MFDILRFNDPKWIIDKSERSSNEELSYLGAKLKKNERFYDFLLDLIIEYI